VDLKGDVTKEWSSNGNHLGRVKEKKATKLHSAGVKKLAERMKSERRKSRGIPSARMGKRGRKKVLHCA